MEFKDYVLKDIDGDLLQEALETHRLTIDSITKDYVLDIEKEKQ